MMAKRLIAKRARNARTFEIRKISFWSQISLLSLLSLLFTPSFAAFEDTGSGAREVALGGASVASTNNAFSLMTNPAALAHMRRQQVVADYSRLYLGLSDGSKISQTYMGYARPVSWGGTLAAGWRQFGVSGLYSERTLSIGYGEWITPRVAAGLAFKQLYHSFEAPTISVDDSGNATSDKPSFFSRYGNSQTAYSADLGVLFKATARHTIGVAVQDFNEPNVALSSQDHEIVPKTVRIGLDFDAKKDLHLMAGLTRREGLSNQMDNTLTGALERTFKLSELRRLALRGSVASGSREFRQMTMGAGYKTGDVTVDYAFQFNFSGIALGQTAGTHRFSIQYDFGPSYEPFSRRRDDGTMRRSRKVARKSDIEQWLGVSQEKVEADETAEMMERTPPPTPKASHADSKGPGIDVQVPAPETSAVPVVPSAVTPEDFGVDLSVKQKSKPETKPVNRVTFLQVVSRMASTYKEAAAARASAENRLQTLAKAGELSRGYVQQRKGEVADAMTLTEKIDQLNNDYDAMGWEGASAAERVENRVKTLESVFASVLEDRDWDMSQSKQVEYKNWVNNAQAAVKQLALVNMPADRRLEFMGEMAKRALWYDEQVGLFVQPKQAEKSTESVPAAVPVPQPKPVVKPAPAVKAIPVVKPAPKPKEAPKVVPETYVGTGGVPAVYTVQEGDTLESLAKRFYGDHKKWRDIYILNEDRLGRGGVLKAGQRLIMPKPQKGSK